jgi:hypothetical protein
MDATTSIGEEASRELRDQIGVTQRSLNAKIESLGGEMRHVMGDLSHEVTERVSAARRAVNPSDWIRMHPVALCMGAVFLGVLAARGRKTSFGSSEGSFSRRIPGEVVKIAFPVLVGIVQSLGRQALEGYLSRSRLSVDPSQQSSRRR